MLIEAEVYDQLQAHFSQYLANKRLRMTAERAAILQCICCLKGHFNSSILQGELEKKHFRVSRATVYNTLDVLVDCGLLVRHFQLGDMMQYELKVISDTHAHLICTKCGTIKEYRNATLRMIIRQQRIPRFTAEYSALYFYGLCAKCKPRVVKKTND